MRMGVFLGSFDPIHIDHLKVINKVVNSGAIDTLFVVPAVHNPWKEHKPAPYYFRHNMVDAAISPFRLCKVNVVLSEIEYLISKQKKDEDIVYSFEVLNTIREQYGGADCEYFLVCGEDVKDSIHKWKNYDEFIKPYWKLLTFDRPTGTCSSTEIRRMISEGKEIYPLVPESVKRIIKDNNLYGHKSQ